MDRFGDRGYHEPQATGRFVSILMARLGNAQIAPLDYVGFGTEMTKLVAELDSGITKKGWTVSTQGLKDALGRFTDAARAFGAARDSVLAAGAAKPWGPVNAALMQVERRLTRPEGLKSNSWFKSLQFASDVDNGYATLAFPSVAEAIRYADAATTQGQGAVALVTGSILAQLGRVLQGTVLLGLILFAFDFLMDFLQMVVPALEIGWVPDIIILAVAAIAITAWGSRKQEATTSAT